MINNRPFTKNRMAIGVTAALALGMSCALQAQEDLWQFDIESQNAGHALVALGDKVGVEIMVTREVGKNVKLAALKGKYTLAAALEKMLDGTGLVYEFVSEKSVMIREEEPEENNPDQENSEPEEVDEEIVVTGSRIARTPSQMAANVLVLDGDELRASGESTLEGALRRLPQNMFGASPVGATVDGSMSVNGAINITGASTINLRGLGSESTLILVDGKRIGKTGVFGGVSDITGIPFRAVERVEILLDGASSIYGSDAVGGVVNIIMKRDFQGMEVTHEYGTPQQGGFEEHDFTVAGGFSWSSGRLDATYEHFQRSNLDGDERPERIAWSSNHNPGLASNIWLFSYQGQLYTPPELISVLGLPADTFWFDLPYIVPGVTDFIANALLPEGQDGTNLSMDDFTLVANGSDGWREYMTNSDASEGISLIPAQKRDSLNLSFDQELELWGEEITLSGTVYHSERQTYAARGGFTFRGEVDDNYPLNPFGTFASIGWFIPSLGAKHFESDQQVSRWSLGLDGKIGESWRWGMSVGQSRDKTDSNRFNEQIHAGYYSPETIAFYEQYGLTLPDLTYTQLLDGGALNLFASDIVAANSLEVLAQLVQPESPSSYTNEENRLEVEVGGTLFSLPGGDMHIVVGADWRQEILETASSEGLVQKTLDNRAVGVTPNNSLQYGAFSRLESRTQRSGYAELLLPVVNADNRIAGVEQLILTGSARYDSYHGQGSGSAWSLGLSWRPIDQIRLNVNKSTSFVMPSFRDQLRETLTNSQIFPWSPNGSRVTLIDENGDFFGFDYIGLQIAGGNPDLKPETATTQVVGLEITPDFLPGLTVKASWRDVIYNNRIATPQTRLVGGVDYVALYPNITRDEQGWLVMDIRATNIAFVESAGIDYGLDYTRHTRLGQFDVSANVGYTSKYNTVTFPGDDPLSQLANVSIASNTVIPATRYSTRLGWHHRGLSVNLTADSSSKTVSTSYNSLGQPDERRIVEPALNTNLTILYDFEQGDLLATVPVWLQGTAMELTVLNVLDDYTEYSKIDMDTGEHSIYSELNANSKDPRGRMFSLSVTKRF